MIFKKKMCMYIPVYIYFNQKKLKRYGIGGFVDEEMK